MAPGPIDDLIWWVAQLFEQLLSKLWEGIQWILDWVVRMLDDLMMIVWDMLSDVFSIIADSLASLIQNIEAVLTEILDALWAFLQEAWDALYEVTIEVLDSISNYIADVWAELEVLVAEIIDTVVTWVQDAVTWVRDIVDVGIEGIVSIIESGARKLAEFAAPLLEWVQGALEAVIVIINRAWEELIFGAEAIIDAVAKKLVDIREGFKDAALEVVAKIGEIGDDMLGPLRDSISDIVDAYMPKDDPASTARAMKALEGVHSSKQSMQDYRAWWAGEWRNMQEGGALRKSIFLSAMFLASAVPTLFAISQTLTHPVVQEYSKEFPFQILTPADATAAFRRELITKGEAIEQIRKAGYSERQAEDIVMLTANVPAQPDLIHMRWREIINDAMFDKALRTHGIDEPWRKHIKDAAQMIPPAQDLIHMAVRDVWNPEAVRVGKLNELFPEELAEWTKKQGLSEHWARKYWAAHWVLPSPNQGFEMLHRAEIGDKELDILLQALDVAPGWRDPLKAIAYHPYTRVDVRRMHRIGVLDDDEILKAYRDLGYDEEKARGLQEFTIALNEPKGAENPDELGELNRTTILGFYEDGLVNRDRAQSLLETAGFTPEAASLYLDSTDLAEERAERKTETALIIELAIAGSINWDEAEDRLRALGLETKEVERAVTKLLRARQRKTKLPTKADADQFLMAGLLQKPEYEDLLARLGYSPKWVGLYLQIAEMKRGKG